MKQYFGKKISFCKKKLMKRNFFLEGFYIIKQIKKSFKILLLILVDSQVVVIACEDFLDVLDDASFFGSKKTIKNLKK